METGGEALDSAQLFVRGGKDTTISGVENSQGLANGEAVRTRVPLGSVSGNVALVPSLKRSRTFWTAANAKKENIGSHQLVDDLRDIYNDMRAAYEKELGMACARNAHLEELQLDFANTIEVLRARLEEADLLLEQKDAEIRQLLPYKEQWEQAHSASVEAALLDACAADPTAIVAHLPLGTQLTVRHLSRSLRAAVDESLTSLTILNASKLGDIAREAAEAGDAPFVEQRRRSALAWLAARCPDLRVLDLVQVPGVARETPWGIDDATLALVVERCPLLQHVNVSGSADVTDAGVMAVAARCRGLMVLDVSRCVRVTGAGISAVGRVCQGLRTLVTAGCYDVTDDGIAAVAGNCASLRHVNVTGCTEVSDESVRLLAGCGELRHLCVRGCSRVTDASVARVAASCPGLLHLDARRTQVTRQGVADSLPPLCRFYC
eukprot:jgi/Mesvir1/5689/Mv15704-RA.1